MSIELAITFTCNFLQKEVLVDVNIEQPTLYRIIFRFVNQNPTTVMADVTLTPDVRILNTCRFIRILGQ